MFGREASAAEVAVVSTAAWAGRTSASRPQSAAQLLMRRANQSFQPLCIGRLSRLLASRLPMNFSFFGSHFSLVSSRAAISAMRPR